MRDRRMDDLAAGSGPASPPIVGDDSRNGAPDDRGRGFPISPAVRRCGHWRRTGRRRGGASRRAPRCHDGANHPRSVRRNGRERRARAGTTLAQAARLIREARQLPLYGIAGGEPTLDYPRLLAGYVK